MSDTPEISEPLPSELDQIDGLLNPSETATLPLPDTKDETDGEGADTEVVEDVEAQAAHKAEMKALYAREVTLQDGTVTTFGELKDAYQQRSATDLALIERENAMLAKEREVMGLSEYLNVVPEHIRAEAVARMQETVKTEFALLMQAIPEWRDAPAFQTGRQNVLDLAKEYGLDASGIVDHRQIKLLRDYANLRQGIRQAKESLTASRGKEAPLKKQPYTSKASEAQNQIQNAAKSKSQGDKLAAIDKLIGA